MSITPRQDWSAIYTPQIQEKQWFFGHVGQAWEACLTPRLDLLFFLPPCVSCLVVSAAYRLI